MSTAHRAGPISLFACLLLAPAGDLAGQLHAPHRIGRFTADQAERGGKVYSTYCSGCHGSDLEGAVGPALSGPVFLKKWGSPEREAAALYHLIRTTMPKPTGGSPSQ